MVYRRDKEEDGEELLRACHLRIGIVRTRELWGYERFAGGRRKGAICEPVSRSSCEECLADERVGCRARCRDAEREIQLKATDAEKASGEAQAQARTLVSRR